MKLILMLVFITNALIATSYLLTGAYNGAASCCVGAAQSIINYFYERKNKPLPAWLICLYALAFIVVNLLVFSHITDLIAMIASLTFIMGISQKNGKKYRIWTLVNTVLWLTYDLVNLSFGPLTTHLIQLTTVFLGMVMHDRKSKDTVS